MDPARGLTGCWEPDNGRAESRRLPQAVWVLHREVCASQPPLLLAFCSRSPPADNCVAPSLGSWTAPLAPLSALSSFVLSVFVSKHSSHYPN